ncbi:UBA/TS-N domain-containing protein [Besnoitia besnoiti]|uniref:UBA/TS-N domain-containing protein n=1 Tax=Besnoitia besnoiti TaxID=94643 RepID=A0A2A9MQL7_BESBE|nr:UBA/TS-N domain-containing protein [Besnoitia besnoiti]PFH38593.1 UBA/TS-N domain-containing protein [Besnoitia besnoiti]
MEPLISVEKAKIRLRLSVLFAFSLWALLGVAAWWRVTSVRRSPIPALVSFPISQRVASRLASPAASEGGSGDVYKAAADVYARWEAAYKKKRRQEADEPAEGAKAAASPVFALLPPLVSGFSLELVPLCGAVRPAAADFFDWLQGRAAALREAGKVSWPEDPKLYGSLFPAQEAPEGADATKGDTARGERRPFVTDLRLLFSPTDRATSLLLGLEATGASLLRVALIDSAVSRASSSACASAAPERARRREDALTYTIFFSAERAEGKKYASRFTLHAESAITVVAPAPSSEASTSSAAAQRTYSALAQLLRTSFFAPLNETRFFFPFSSQYDLSFWLGGDSVPRRLGAKQTGQHRLAWRFKRDVYAPFLEPFFSRLAVVFNFLHTQSQVVPHSGIASLLTPPADSASAAPWVLDMASQHHLHAVASTWQPEHIMTTPTHAPAPSLNLAVYRSPVPVVLRGGKPGRKIRREPSEAATGQGTETDTVTGIAIPGWGGLAVASPVSASAPASSAIFQFPARDMQHIAGVWVAQLRTFFALPPTLADYFAEDALEGGAAGDADTGRWRVRVVGDSEERASFLDEANENDVVMLWESPREEAAHANEKDPEKANRAILVVAQHADAGVGVWEVWRLARRVYVQLVERAVSNIRSLQTIIENQTELAVQPHVGEALERALTFIDCSAEALQGRICETLPDDLHKQLLSSDVAAEAGRVLDAHATGRDARGVAPARFLGLALALARAAFQDSLEALQEESVTGKSHFSFEFKCAIYVPLAVPVLLPLVVGFMKLNKHSKQLAKAAAALQ